MVNLKHVFEIGLEFQDFQDISLQDTLGIEVIYALWGPHAKKGPSAISQGKLLEALANPHNAYRGKVRGIFSVVKGSERTKRRDYDLAEISLIMVAKEIGMPPSRNLMRGTSEAMLKAGPKRGEFRIEITGCDPFAGSANGRRGSAHWIELNLGALRDGEEGWMRHNWRVRA